MSALFLNSCARIGTQTLYRTPENFYIQKVGFSQFEGDNIINKAFPHAGNIFATTVIQTFNEYGFKKPKNIMSKISFEYPDNKEIIKICNENDLDGILLTKLKFIHSTYDIYSIPTFQNYDTEVEMKLIDKFGILLINTKHNTFTGNSYIMPPTADRTVHDGTKGALKRMIEEMGIN